MRIVALDSYDNRHEGEEYDAPDHIARKLIAKGLAKAGSVPLNKMAPVSDNKQNPTEAVGEEARSSSSRAARVSTRTTSRPSNDGESAADTAVARKPRGRQRKTEESSQ